MRKNVFGLLLATALLAGCQVQPQDSRADPQLTLGPRARNYLHIEGVQQGLASGNLLRAGVRLHNASTTDKTLRYRFSWRDANGFELPGLANRWEQIELRPAEPVALDRVAPSPQAVAFHIYLFDINSNSAATAQGYEP